MSTIQARLELIILFTNCLQYYIDVIRLGIYMFVHDNNVSVSCTVPLLTFRPVKNDTIVGEPGHFE